MKPHKKIGEKTEAMVLSELIKRNYKVSIPFGENTRYDFIIEKNGKLERIQCKTSRIINGCIEFNTSSSTHHKRRDYKNQIDAFITYNHELNTIYYIPIKEATRTSMRLRLKHPKLFGNMKTINWASKYQI